MVTTCILSWPVKKGKKTVEDWVTVKADPDLIRTVMKLKGGKGVVYLTPTIEDLEEGS